MATKKKAVKGARMDYTRNKAGCMLYTIEVCLRHDVVIEEAEAMRDALETLQNYGAAEIVQIDNVAESWDDACRILHKRMVSV